MCINLPPNILRIQSLKSRPYVDREHSRVQKMNLSHFRKKSEKLRKNYNYIGMDPPPHAVRIQNLKFRPFVLPEKSRLRKNRIFSYFSENTGN